MKLGKFLNLTGLLLMSMLYLSSCGDDDPIILPPPPGINVANGFYITQTGVDPVFNSVLSAETVEADGFGSQSRAGYLAGYVYLDAASYGVVEITDGEISKTVGGSASTVAQDGAACGTMEYTLVTGAADGGAGFSVPTSGLHKVTYDQETGEIVVFNIGSAGIIGSATVGGWGSDTELAGSATTAGGSWEATGAILRSGEFKLRFNCNWNIDRRIDPDAGFDFTNGYMLFTNFGGTTSNLLPGNDGSNIPIDMADEGEYTVGATWTPGSGFAMDLTRTGDAPVITFVPDDHEWALTGDATPNGWADDDESNDPIGVDHDFNYEGFDSGSSTYTWELSEIALIEGAFKFRSEDNWNENLGWGQIALSGDTADFSDTSGNVGVSAAGAGNYKIVMTTSDDGVTYGAVFTKL